MKSKKFYIILSVIAIAIIGAGVFVYLYIKKQVEKILAYDISFKSITSKKIGINLIDFDLWLTVKNPSDISYDITGQEYDIYINNVFVTKTRSSIKFPIRAKAENPIGINVRFSPVQFVNKLGTKGLNNILLNPTTVNLTIDMKLKTKFYSYPVYIEYKYETNVKELLLMGTEKVGDVSSIITT